MWFEDIYEQILNNFYDLNGVGFDKFKEHCCMAMQNERHLNMEVCDLVFNESMDEYKKHFTNVEGTINSLITIFGLIRHYSNFVSFIISIA